MVRSRSETNLNRIFLNLCTSPQLRPKNGHQTNQREHNPPLPHLQPIKSVSCTDLTNIQADHQLSCINENESEDLDLLTPLPVSSKEPMTPSTIPLSSMESTGFIVQSGTSILNRSPFSFETTLLNTTEKPRQQCLSLYNEYTSLDNSTDISFEQASSFEGSTSSLQCPTEKYCSRSFSTDIPTSSPLQNSTGESRERCFSFQHTYIPLQNSLDKSSEQGSSTSVHYSSLHQPTVKDRERYAPIQTTHSPLPSPSLKDKKSKTVSLNITPSNDKKHQDYTIRLRDRLKSRGHLRKFFLS